MSHLGNGEKVTRNSCEAKCINVPSVNVDWEAKCIYVLGVNVDREAKCIYALDVNVFRWA